MSNPASSRRARTIQRNRVSTSSLSKRIWIYQSPSIKNTNEQYKIRNSCTTVNILPHHTICRLTFHIKLPPYWYYLFYLKYNFCYSHRIVIPMQANLVFSLIWKNYQVNFANTRLISFTNKDTVYLTLDSKQVCVGNIHGMCL